MTFPSLRRCKYNILNTFILRPNHEKVDVYYWNVAIGDSTVALNIRGIVPPHIFLKGL